jgi:hypothetical protein
VLRVTTSKELQASFARLEQKIADEKNLKILKWINTLFIVLAFLSLLLEFVVFSFEHWFINICLFADLSFVTINLCLTVLNPESRRFWVKFRQYCAYLPFGITTVLTLVELVLFGSLIEERIAEEYTPEERATRNIRLYATMALLVPSIPVILQGLTFSVYFKWLSDYDKAQRRYEIADRLRRQDQEGLIDYEI